MYEGGNRCWVPLFHKLLREKRSYTGAGYDGFEPTLYRQQGLVFTLLFLLFRSLSMSLALPGTDATARRRSPCAHFSVSEVIQRCVS